MIRLRGTWMRGGTSKCWLFNAVDVNPLLQQHDLDALLTSAFGSGDPLQIDGVGGGSSVTSKAAIVRRSAIPGIDVDYLFAQVAIGQRRVEWGSNCGNCATAIGLYALQSAMVPVDRALSTVRMRNQNTGAVLSAEIATPDGVIPSDGDAGVPGTRALGVPVSLTFADVVSSRSALLPTGRITDTVDAHGRRYEATLVSAGAPAALFCAEDFGLTGTESNDELTECLPTLIELREKCSLAMGLRQPGEPVVHAIPKVGIVGRPRDYVTADGATVGAEDHDISVRMVSMMAPHPAIGLTSAVAVAAAAAVPGSTVARQARPGTGHTLRIGTAAGVITTSISPSNDGLPSTVSLHRAARRIATAELFLTVPTPALASAR